LPSLLLGIALIVIGVVFCSALLRAYQKAVLQDSWQSAPAIVLSSALQELRPTPNSSLRYELDLEYSYQYQGVDYIGSKIARIEGSSSSKRKIKRLKKKYPTGSRQVCYFDPQTPELAILEKDSKAPIYNLWYPGLFVLGGVGIIIGSIWRQMKL